MFSRKKSIGAGNHKIKLDNLSESDLEKFIDLKDKIVDCIENMPSGAYMISDSESQSYVKFDDHEVLYSDTPSIFKSESKKYGNRRFLLTNSGKEKKLSPLYVFHSITGALQTNSDLKLVRKSFNDTLNDIANDGFSSRNPQPGGEEYYPNAAIYSDLFLGGKDNINFSISNTNVDRLQIAFLKTDKMESTYQDKPIKFHEGLYTTVQFAKPEDIALVVNFSPFANMNIDTMKSQYVERMNQIMNEFNFKNYIFRERDIKNNSFKVLKTYLEPQFKI